MATGDHVGKQPRTQFRQRAVARTRRRLTAFEGSVEPGLRLENSRQRQVEQAGDFIRRQPTGRGATHDELDAVAV
jgi:hypothetical protein